MRSVYRENKEQRERLAEDMFGSVFNCQFFQHDVDVVYEGLGRWKWIQLIHFSEVAIFWFSSHNLGEVAVIQKFQYFQN